MSRLYLTAFIFVSETGHAFAHAGHLGELAGHAHWLGLGAAVAAGALAAAIAKKKGRKTDADKENTPEEGAAEGEAA